VSNSHLKLGLGLRAIFDSPAVAIEKFSYHPKLLQSAATAGVGVWEFNKAN
jgi:hypothetical protein